MANNKKAVKLILKSGFANINQLDKDSKTAMDYAVEHGHNKMVKKLYKNNGKVTSDENAQQTKKIIIRPFKAAFYIGLPIFIVGLCIIAFAPFVGKGFEFVLVGGLGYFTAGAIPMIIGDAGRIYRSRKNLLLS